MAYPTYKSSASSFSNNITIPTVVSGDLIVVFGSENGGENGAVYTLTTTPTGWTKHVDGIFYKISAGTESGSSLNFGAGSFYIYSCIVINKDTFSSSNPINTYGIATQASGVSTTRTGASVTPTLANTLAIFSVHSSNDFTLSGYSGGSVSYTEDIDVLETVGDDRAIQLAHGDCATTSAFTITATSSSNLGYSRLYTLIINSPGQTFTIDETLSLSETLTTSRTRLFTIAETTTLSEVVSALKGISFTIAEALSLSEVITTTRTLLLSVAESLGLVEVLAQVRKKWNNDQKNSSSWNTSNKSTATWAEQTKNSATWTNQDKS